MRFIQYGLLSFILFCISIPFYAKAQEPGTDTLRIKTDTLCEQKALGDVFRTWRHMPPKVQATKNVSLLLVPVLSSNPATGFMFGAAGQLVFSMNPKGGLFSSLNGSANYTTKNQFIFQMKNNIYLNSDKIFMSGDWRIFLFSQATYGLGTSSPEGGALDYQFNLNNWESNEDSLIQPMEFDHYRFHQTISWKVARSLFIGFGYHLDWMNNIRDLRLDTIRPLYTSHYLYSRQYGFDLESYTLSGLSFNLTIDTRDNLVNAYKGCFFNFNWRLNPESFGNNNNADLLSAEWRSFHRLSDQNPRHLIGFWALANFSQKGGLPYLLLPALAYGQRGRSGRGYTQGRYRGTDMIYTEAEYRFPISRCGGILGGVAFVNMTTTNRPDGSEKLFEYIAPGYGAGLRIMVDKQSRTNIQVDVGFGENSMGIYFGAAETF